MRPGYEVINGIEEETTQHPERCHNLSTPSKLLLHPIDTLRLTTIIQAWFGTIGFKVLLQLDAHLGIKISHEAKVKISTYMIFASFTAAVATKVLKHTKISETQDHLFAVSIGPMVYLISTLASYAGKSSPWFFWPVTAAVASVAGVCMKYAISDSHSVGKEPATYDTYTKAREGKPLAPAWKHHLAYILPGLTYGLSGLVLAWCIERELHGKTVPLKPWEYVVAGAVPIGIYVALAYKYALDKTSSVFNRAVSFSKFIRDSAYTYAGLSGITVSVLALADKSNEQIQEHGKYLTVPYIALSLISGLYSAGTTLFRHEEVYNANRTTLDMPKDIANAISSCFSTIFSKCCCCYKGNSANDDAEAGIEFEPRGGGYYDLSKHSFAKELNNFEYRPQ